MLLRREDKRGMTAERQSSDTVLMVRPKGFAFHAEAAATNAFASPSGDAATASRAIAEFDSVAERLTAAGVEVLFLEDQADPARPDAVFPNNWVSFHADGTAVLYPMATAARRLERNWTGLAALLCRAGFKVNRLIDLSGSEEGGRFLEGTGSLILDRPARKAFAAVGPRTDREAVAEFDRTLGYSTFTFDAGDLGGHPIYHTNVLLSLGTDFAVVCLDVVPEAQRRALVEQVEQGGRTLIAVDYGQLERFACNILELRSRAGSPLITMSSAARSSFRPDQLRQLERWGELIVADIPTIESVGGGSIRCMIADVHLPRA